MDEPQIFQASGLGLGQEDGDDLGKDLDDQMQMADDMLPIMDEIGNYTTRELRPQRRGAQQYSTWVDNDQTGDYDPEAPRTVRTPRTGTSNRTRLVAAKERVSVERPKLIITLEFKTPEGKDTVTEIVNKAVIKALAKDVADPTRYKFRPRVQEDDSEEMKEDLTAKPWARGCKGCIGLAGDPESSQCSLIHDGRHWPCITCDDDNTECHLIIPPKRKLACESCRQRRVPCSYTYTRNHGATCVQCATESRSCVAGPVAQFIRQRITYDRDYEVDPMPMKSKGKTRALEECYECTQAGVPCRYDPEDDAAPCETCVLKGHPCTIGEPPPPKAMASRSRKRKRGRNPPTEAEKEGGEEDMKESTKNTSKVNGDEEQEQGECYAEERHGHDMNEVTRAASSSVLPQASRTTQRTSPLEHHDHYNEDPVRPQRPSVPPRRTPISHHANTKPKLKVPTRKLTTKFCHPIIFNCDEREEQAGTGCDFCDDPVLRIRGLGPIEATVIDFQDERQYIEVGGGHRGRGYSSTRICLECTTELLSIMDCPGHRMSRIQGPRHTEEEKKQSMLDLYYGRNVRPMRDYCGVCCNLAQYECRACEKGYGLRLCKGCARTLTEEYGGDLQDLLDDVRDEPAKGAPFGLRADAELLNKKQDGTGARFLASLASSEKHTAWQVDH